MDAAIAESLAVNAAKMNVLAEVVLAAASSISGGVRKEAIGSKTTTAEQKWRQCGVWDGVAAEEVAMLVAADEAVSADLYCRQTGSTGGA